MKKLILLITFLAATLVMSAGQKGPFYSKVNVSVQSGEGKVYASTNATFSESLTTSATISGDGTSKSADNSEQPYYLFAQPSEGYGFRQWSDNSTENPHRVIVNATSTSANKPTTQNFTAIFEP